MRMRRKGRRRRRRRRRRRSRRREVLDGRGEEGLLTINK